MRPNPAYTFINPGHKYIGWTAGLIDRQIFSYFLPADPGTVQMNQRCLGQRRKRLVKTVNHHIRPAAHGILRQLFRKGKMRSMRFIHDQRNPMGMYYFGNLSHAGHHTVISGRSDHHCLNLCVLFQSLFHILRQNDAVYPISPVECG